MKKKISPAPGVKNKARKLTIEVTRDEILLLNKVLNNININSAGADALQIVGSVHSLLGKINPAPLKVNRPVKAGK